MTTQPPRRSLALLNIWRALREHFRAGARRARIADAASLGEFLDSRSSYVAQASLYGYLRTRAGSRYPELFARPEFLSATNVAKWHLWLACVSDLTVYTGGLVRHRTLSGSADVGELMGRVVGSLLRGAAATVEAGDEFEEHAARVRVRIASCAWEVPEKADTLFSESPAALVRWAPVVEELKALDEDIVRNSVRFRWQEVRRELQQALDAELLMAAHAAGARQNIAPGETR